jgi:hypothetical protein
MKLAEYRQEYQEYSKQASQSTRQLTLAGVAAAWLFISGFEQPARIPVVLFVGFLLLASSLFVDVLQYTAGALIYRTLYRFREKHLPRERHEVSIRHSDWYPFVIECFYLLKLLLALLGYICLALFLFRKLT